MPKRGAKVLLVGLAAAIAIGLSATAALAATSWTVRPGGAIKAKSGITTLKDTSTGTTLKCTTSVGKGKFKRGRGLSGKGIGKITSIKFRNCTGPLGLTFTVHSSHLPWKINAVSYNRRTGTTTGTITGIHATLSGPSCSAAVDGTGASRNNGRVAVRYVNRTHKLTVKTKRGNLHIYNVSGCAGLIHNGDRSTFKAAYKLSPKQTIKRG
jgi:hypothetical protein